MFSLLLLLLSKSILGSEEQQMCESLRSPKAQKQQQRLHSNNIGGTPLYIVIKIFQVAVVTVQHVFSIALPDQWGKWVKSVNDISCRL